MQAEFGCKVKKLITTGRQHCLMLADVGVEWNGIVLATKANHFTLNHWNRGFSFLMWYCVIANRMAVTELAMSCSFSVFIFML